MKAIGLTEFGGPEVLRVLDLPAPEAGPGEIRVRVHAATVNPVDTLVRRGIAFVSDAEPPYVPGMDAAGVVDQIGKGVDTDLAVRAVRDGGRVATSGGGVQVPGERGIETRNTFVPQYARENARLDRLRELAEKGSLTPRVARTLPAEQAPEAHRLNLGSTSGSGEHLGRTDCVTRRQPERPRKTDQPRPET